MPVGSPPEATPPDRRRDGGGGALPPKSSTAPVVSCSGPLLVLGGIRTRLWYARGAGAGSPPVRCSHQDDSGAPGATGAQRSTHSSPLARPSMPRPPCTATISDARDAAAAARRADGAPTASSREGVSRAQRSGARAAAPVAIHSWAESAPSEGATGRNSPPSVGSHRWSADIGRPPASPSGSSAPSAAAALITPPKSSGRPAQMAHAAA